MQLISNAPISYLYAYAYLVGYMQLQLQLSLDLQDCFSLIIAMKQNSTKQKECFYGNMPRFEFQKFNLPIRIKKSLAIHGTIYFFHGNTPPSTAIPILGKVTNMD